MTKEQAIEAAAELAYEEEANMVIGKIAGDWAIAHDEDMGRQYQMDKPKYRVDSSANIVEIG